MKCFSSSTDKIAITGYSCFFPPARNPEELWQILIERKQTTTTNVTREELGLETKYFYDPTQSDLDKFYYLQGSLIRDLEFDPNGYYLPAPFLESLDPLFQATLYTAKQALERTNYLGKIDVLSRCGVILGNLSFPTPSSHQFFSSFYRKAIEPPLRELLGAEHYSLATLPSKVSHNPLNAAVSSLPATIVARALSLSGMHFCFDAACSSSLYAIKLACHQLLGGNADLMLAGSISYADPLYIKMLFSGVRAYPDNGISCPLSKSSRGLIPADGIGMVVLKRYEDALRDGDPIHATIAGIGLSNDGKGKHLLSPNIRGQLLAYERAYAEAGFDPTAIDYLECHATGTPLGDSTELASIDRFFAQQGATPLIGNIKANIGHTLTASGMASVIKVLLSLERETIPPTLTSSDLPTSPHQAISPQQIVRQPTPWPKGDTPRRAAISAFGFGGTNAHLILEEGQRREKVDNNRLSLETGRLLRSMAIVGMDAVFGSCDGLDDFERNIYEGNQHFRSIPPQRWQGVEEQAPDGAYIESVEMDGTAYKIPPNELKTLNPQQLLMLKVADRAIRDAQLSPGGKVAVVIAMEMELSLQRLQQRWHLPWQIEQGLQRQNLGLSDEALAQLTALVKDSLHPAAGLSEHVGYVGNIIASRISALWDFTGLSLTLSASESSTFKALEVAQLLLETGEVEAVVLGAVDLAGGFESISWHKQLADLNSGTPTLSHDLNANGWLVGEGAGAVVLQSLERAQSNQKNIYAAIDAIGRIEAKGRPTEIPESEREKMALPLSADPGAVRQSCLEAFAIAGVKPSDIGYLEVCGSGIPDQDAAEREGIVRAYQGSRPELDCAIGSVKANIGHTWAASGMASLIKTALCLYHRYIPAVPQWSSPKEPQEWQKSPFYVVTESRGWFVGPETKKRRAAINGLGIDGSCSHLILSEFAPPIPRNSRHLELMPLCLFPLAASDRPSLEEALKSFQQAVNSGDSLKVIAERTFAKFQVQAKNEPAYTLAILARDRGQLERELEQALVGIAKSFETGKDWQTPSGSYFTAHPLSQKGKTAFVYPAAYNSYLGIFRQLFRLFPSIYTHSILVENSNRANNVLKQLYPRSLSKLTPRQLEKLEWELLKDPLAMLESEIAIASFATGILQETFQIHPDCAFGYSLGECSMMMAQSVWRDHSQGSRAFHESPLFKSRLSGSKDAVREYWNCNDLEGDALWQTYILLAPVDRVREYLQHESRLYLTQINTPNELIIAGEAAACKKAIATLQCQAIQAPFNHVIHCAAMKSEYEELVRLHTLPIDRQLDIPLYSAAQYRPIPHESAAIGQNLARGLCQQMDFPRLVNQVYADGSRIFIEVGAGGNCSRWIGEILKGREHLCVSINKRGADDHATLLKALAKLTSHGIAMDLSPLYEQKSKIPRLNQSLVKSISLGGPSIASTLLKNRDKKFIAASPAARQAEQNGDRDQISPQKHDRSSSETQPVLAAQNSRPYSEPKNLRQPQSQLSEKTDGTQKRKAEIPQPVFAGALQSSLKNNATKPETNSTNGPKSSDLPPYPPYPPYLAMNSQNGSQTLLAKPPVPGSLTITPSSTAPSPSFLEEFFLPVPGNPQYQKLSENHSRVTQAHAAFLENQRELMRQTSNLIQLQLDVLQEMNDQHGHDRNDNEASHEFNAK